ncbi:MAG: hypothetical protein FJW14_08170 [Acidimicrobiia bacterium]|nr:hypothetical protein [Acidimicrobiia bacterium]
MALQTGTKLGPYQILAQLGAGGMGEVYKATDTRLNRTVAIKVLPPHFSANPEMKQRFEREAQTIAALNHPHICVLYDVGRQDDIDFLVMEHLEGETLAARLARGGLPLDEALTVAVAVADALEKAHGQGVTHRDLKPGNVMLTAGGAKLLDFGLAKLQQGHPAAAAAPGTPLSAVGPLTTVPGTILGTMQYMAPEQLEGKEADARTDIFAFGAVLYEMLTGKRAFEGKSQPHLIAAIVSSQPDPVSRTHPSVPAALDFLVERCLAKDPEERVQTATDLVWKLRWIAEGRASKGASGPRAAGRRARTAQLALAAVVLLVIAMAALIVIASRDTAPRQVTRFLIDVPDMPVAEAISVSPDGRLVAYSASDSGATAVFVRPLNAGGATKLAGTEGAGRLFWSPDSRWVAFFAGGRLKRVEATGGPPQNVCETPDLLGGTWNEDGVIVFASSKGLQRVLAAGGQPSPIELGGDLAKQNPREPYFLPGGRQFLLLAGEGEADAAVYAASLDSPDTTRLVTSASNAVYAEPGYLLYHREGTLYAQAFDADDVEVSGEALRVADGLPYADGGAAAFAASHAGILIYRNDPQRQAASAGAGPEQGGNLPDRPLRWASRTGTGDVAGAPGGWTGVDLSPDGRRAAVHRHDGEGGDIWIFEDGQTTPSRFTFDAGQDNSSPVWSPDGARIAFASQRGGKSGLYTKAADNTSAEELALESDRPAMPMSWTGNRLVYWTSDSKTGGDIWAVPLDGDRKPVPLLQTRADERTPQVSPDGRWLAYSSNETGRSEIYIRPFPDGPGRIQVSVNGGVYPRWRRDGRELYFMSLVVLGSVMASDISVSGASVQRGVPRTLFQSFYAGGEHPVGQYHAFAAAPAGDRFLMAQFESLATGFGRGVVGGFNFAAAFALPFVTADRRAAAAPSSLSTAPITVVLDWTAGLRQ